MLKLTFILAIAMEVVAVCHAGTDEVIVREALSEQRTFDLGRYRSLLDTSEAAILTPNDAKSLIVAASATEGVAKENPNNPQFGTRKSFANVDAADFYCVFHVLRWGAPSQDSGGHDQIKPDKQHWYVYHSGKTWRQEDFADKKRIFGSRNVWLLFVHLNIAPNFGYNVRYDVDLKDITPAPLGHLLDLAKLMAGGSAEANREEIRNIWGAHNITVSHLPNEMTIIPQSVSIPTVDRESTTERLGDPAKFVNEGRYHVDFSVGLPIKKVSELSFDTANEVVTAKKADKQNVYALIDYYPWKTDVRTQSFSYYPYLVGGVAVAKQPLHKCLVALGFGPKFAQFYFGALFVKQQQLSTLKAGDTVTSAQFARARRSGYEPQLAIGLNITVRGANDLLKNK